MGFFSVQYGFQTRADADFGFFRGGMCPVAELRRSCVRHLHHHRRHHRSRCARLRHSNHVQERRARTTTTIFRMTNYPQRKCAQKLQRRRASPSRALLIRSRINPTLCSLPTHDNCCDRANSVKTLSSARTPLLKTPLRRLSSPHFGGTGMISGLWNVLGHFPHPTR